MPFYEPRETSFPMKWVSIPLSLIALAVILGNSLVILAAIRSKSLRTPPHIYIVSLAVVDLSVGLFILPLNILHLINNHVWTCGATICGIWLTGDITLCTVSIFHLIAIASDRYRTVTEGISYLQRRTTKSVFRILAIMWIVALWIALPPVIGWNKADWGYQLKDNGKWTCQLTQAQGYILHSSFGTFIFPMTIMVSIYMGIYMEIKARLHERSKVSGMEKSTDGNETDSSIDLLESRDGLNDDGKSVKKKHSALYRLKAMTLTRSKSHPAVIDDFETGPSGSGGNGNGKGLDRQRSQSDGSDLRPNKELIEKNKPSSQIQEFIQKKLKFSLSREKQAAKTLGMIIAAFMLCWFPFTCIYVINAFLPMKYQASQGVFEVFTWIGYCNSGLNPIIYSVLDKEFREAFKRLLPSFTCFRKANEIGMK
jgi:hypothetical protein